MCPSNVFKNITTNKIILLCYFLKQFKPIVKNIKNNCRIKNETAENIKNRKHFLQ